MATVLVARNKERMNAYTAYKVIVNDLQVAEVNVGEEVLLNLNPDDRLKLMMTWSGSKEFIIPEGVEEVKIQCGGNLTYNIIGNAGGALFLAIVIGTNLLVGSEVGKKIGLGLALCVMLLVLYMLTVGKSNWIKVVQQ